MKAIKNPSQRKVLKAAHKCLCGHADYLHEAITGECRAGGCKRCVKFICTGHGRGCTAEGRFTVPEMPVNKRGCKFEPFTVSEVQTLDVCIYCGQIKREIVRQCRPRKAKAQAVRPAIIVRRMESA